MPKKPTTTREDMIEGAFRLIREHGQDAFSARNLAAFLGCSTQPIMYRFPDLSELMELAWQETDKYHTEYILSGGSLLEIGLRYIRFAAEETELFRFLFQSGRFAGKNLPDLIREPGNAPLLAAAASEFGIGEEEAADLFEVLYTAVHGTASLIANSAMHYDPAAAERMLLRLAEGLMERNENT